MIISLILIYIIIGSIFMIACLWEFRIDDYFVLLLGMFWIIVLPLMIIYILISTIVKLFKMCWK